MSSIYAVQAAIYATLTVDSQLMGLVKGVFDDVEKNQQLPYITFGQHAEFRLDTFDKIGKEVETELHIWSSYKGFKESLDIINRINSLLDYQALSVSGNTLVYCRLDEVINTRDPDKITRHSIIKVKTVVQKT
jgi:hypothetical protein